MSDPCGKFALTERGTMPYTFDAVRDPWNETEDEDFDMFSDTHEEDEDELNLDAMLAEADALEIGEDFE